MCYVQHVREIHFVGEFVTGSRAISNQPTPLRNGTMAALNTLHDLLIHQLRDIYSAEKQIVKALPKMAKRANSDELQAALTSHLDETEEHVERLEQAFELLGVNSRGPKCKGMEGLIEEGKELLEEEDVEPNVLDAGIIAASQRIEHYEIAAYGASEWPPRFRYPRCSRLLCTIALQQSEAKWVQTSCAVCTRFFDPQRQLPLSHPSPRQPSR